MNISSIKYLAKSSDSTKRWRCKHGIGVFRNFLVLYSQSHDIQNVAKAVVFALSGRRLSGIEEVTLELTDNAGDTWEIWRGTSGSRFSHNGRMIPTDEAQRSMLAALLDMEPGIAHGNGLVSPVLYRILTCKKGFFGTVDALNGESQTNGEPDAETVIQVLAEECAKLMNQSEFGNSDALARLAPNLTTLLARWSEIQTAPVVKQTGGEIAPSLGLIESMTRELDHLQQIDFLCRKMTDIHESAPRLATQIESIDESISNIVARWSERALQATMDPAQWNRGMELLVRVRAYSRLVDTAGKLQRVCSKKLKPAAEKSMSQWNQFLSGSEVTGQEVESCLASMLLGMKQLGLDIEKLEEPAEKSEAIARRDSNKGWFDRLKGKADIVEAQERHSLNDHHLDWIRKSIRDVESLKASIEYALKSVQAFSDEFDKTKIDTTRELALMDDLALKATEELTKLKQMWNEWASAVEVPTEISIEEYLLLGRDAHEFESLHLKKTDLRLRLDERLDLQGRLESQIRQWWNTIGSDKTVDISNPAFLVAEARAALRHRDTRRQRVQKMIKDAARFARDESLLQWNYKRRTEILTQWNEAFSSVGLLPLEMNDERVGAIVRLGSAINAMKQLQTVREQTRFVNTDVWGPRSDSAVHLYLWDQEQPEPRDFNLFVDMAKKLPTEASSTLTLILTSSEAVAKALANEGFGGGMLSPADKAPRAGAERTPESNRRADSSPLNRPTAKEGGSSQLSKVTKDSKSREFINQDEPQISQRAAAALKLLNPKTNR